MRRCGPAGKRGQRRSGPRWHASAPGKAPWPHRSPPLLNEPPVAWCRQGEGGDARALGLMGGRLGGVGETNAPRSAPKPAAPASSPARAWTAASGGRSTSSPQAQSRLHCQRSLQRMCKAHRVNICSSAFDVASSAFFELLRGGGLCHFRNSVGYDENENAAFFEVDIYTSGWLKARLAPTFSFYLARS